MRTVVIGSGIDNLVKTYSLAVKRHETPVFKKDTLASRMPICLDFTKIGVVEIPYTV